MWIGVEANNESEYEQYMRVKQIWDTWGSTKKKQMWIMITPFAKKIKK